MKVTFFVIFASLFVAAKGRLRHSGATTEADLKSKRMPSLTPSDKISNASQHGEASSASGLIRHEEFESQVSGAFANHRRLEDGTWEQITYDDFESGWASSNFEDGGSDARIKQDKGNQGTAALRIRDNSGVASSAYHKTNYDVTAYSDLRVKFWFNPNSFENNEDFFVEYSANGGSTWTIVKEYARVDGQTSQDGRFIFQNGNFYNDTVVLSGADYDLTTTEAKIRFRCDASTNSDYVYIDEVLFEGLMPGPLTCPEEHCGSVPVTTMDPIQCDSTGIQAVQLEVFTHDGDDLIELLGPSDPADAAAVVISVPHGGSLEPSYISTRSTSHESCPSSGCVTAKDTNSLEIAMDVVDKFIENYCKVPYVVINKLHRRKLDANRDIDEAAQGDPTAENAWQFYHDFIQNAQNRTISRMGTVTNTVGVEGARGLFMDFHGYSGLEDWDSTDGGPFLQWGYRLSSSTSLDPNDYCPLDDRSPSATSTIGTLTHARFLPGQSYECLVRGPGSLGTRVPALPGMGLCGAGLPSYEHPSPYARQTDPNYCEEPTCEYRSGGYNVKAHEHLDWANLAGIKFNAVQAELPRCIRFNSDVHAQFADSLSVALCSFLRDVFPADIFAPTC